jgi:hypothetical protein
VYGLNFCQRSGLAAGLVFEKRQTVTKADKLFEDEGNIKCSTGFRPPKLELIANKKYKFTSVRQPCGKPLVGS